MKFVIAIVLLILVLWWVKTRSSGTISNTERVSGMSQTCGVDCPDFSTAMTAAAGDRALDARGMSQADYGLENAFLRGATV